MIDRNLIPFLGEKSVRQRLRELDRELVSLMVIISLGFSEVFKGFMMIIIRNNPIYIYGVDISYPIWWIGYVAFWVILFLAEADRVVADKAGDVADKAGEAVDNVKEEIED